MIDPSELSDKERLRALQEEGRPLDFSTFTKDMVSDVKDYVSAQKKVFVLSASERTATLLGNGLRTAVVMLTCATAALFLNIALGWYLGELFGSMPLGFGAVALVYLLFALCFAWWWNSGARDRFILARINDLTDGTEVH